MSTFNIALEKEEKARRETGRETNASGWRERERPGEEEKVV